MPISGSQKKFEIFYKEEQIKFIYLCSLQFRLFKKIIKKFRVLSKIDQKQFQEKILISGPKTQNNFVTMYSISNK